MYSVCTKGYRMVSYIQFGIVFIMVLTLLLWRINKNASVFGLIANYTSLKLMPVYLAFFLILLFIMISKTEKECFCCEINNIL